MNIQNVHDIDKELNECRYCAETDSVYFYYPDSLKGIVCTSCLTEHLLKNSPEPIEPFIDEYQKEFLEFLQEYYTTIKED